MSDLFPLQVMSTLDWKFNSIKTALSGSYSGLQVCNVDDDDQLESFLANESPCILWQWGDLDPAPRDPLYRATFLAGAKVSKDPGNYILSKLISEVLNYFKEDTEILISDWSGVSEDPGKGIMRVTNFALNPQQHDNNASIRFYRIQLMGQRLV